MAWELQLSGNLSCQAEGEEGDEGGHREEREEEKEEEEESRPDCWRRNSVHQVEEEAVETVLRCHLNERFTVIIISTFGEPYRDNSSLAVRRKITF